MTNFIKQSAKQLAGEAIIQKISSNENELSLNQKLQIMGNLQSVEFFKGKRDFIPQRLNIKRKFHTTGKN